jgi:hypothetical protein
MDNSEQSLIIASTRQLPSFELNVWAKETKEKALTQAALIAKVSDGDSKIIAVRAQVELKRIINAIERARKDLKEPILDAGRKLDRLCALESLELEKEFGRVSNAVKEFDDAERRRVAEEERLQRDELERIEREKQAELKRIADEQLAREAEARRLQEEADKKVREAAEAAAKLAAEATNKKQREAAEKARIESEKAAQLAREEKERQDAIVREQAAAANAKAAAIEEKASDAAYCAAKPIEITKVEGQRTSCDWEITKINEWVLLRARPDLVRKIEFDMRAIKDELKRGVKLAGVEAKEVYNAGVKVRPLRQEIDI